MSDTYATAEEAPPLVPPKPFSLDENDDSDDKFEIACVCNKHSTDGSLVQCEKCNYWFHKACIFIPRNPTGEYSRFYCPYCLQQKIRCKCGECTKYNEEMIMCPRCHFYVHTRCELPNDPLKLTTDFICSHCSQNDVPKNEDGMVL